MTNLLSLEEAFANCVDRLADGDSIDQCLADYPQWASELRELLEVGQAPSRLRATQLEVSQMRQRLDSQIESLIEETDFSSGQRSQFRGGLTLLIACFVLLGVGFVMFLQPSLENNFLTDQTPTPTVTVTVLVTSTPTLTATQTATRIQPMFTPTATPNSEDTQASGCAIPTDWVEYQIRSGDTLSYIAVNSQTTVDDLLTANCLEAGTIIITGDSIFVPRLWEITPPNNNTLPSTTNGGEGANNADENQSNNTSGNDSDDDDDDDDDDSDNESDNDDDSNNESDDDD